MADASTSSDSAGADGQAGQALGSSGSGGALNEQTRREAMRTAGRWVGLAALVAVAGWLRWGRGGSTDGGTGTPCGSCGVFMRCTLPEAESTRRQGIGLTTPVLGAGDRAVDGEKPLCGKEPGSD